jgi:hypothetical protein
MSEALRERGQGTYPDVPVVRAADEHLCATFADIHAVDNLFVSGMSS